MGGGSVWRCVVGDAFELRADPIDRPRNTFEFFFDAHRASLELGDIAAHRTKPLDEEIDDDLEVLDSTDALGAHIGCECTRALSRIDGECVQLGDAVVDCSTLMGIKSAGDSSFDARGEDRAQIGGDLFDLIDLGGQVLLMIRGGFAHA